MEEKQRFTGKSEEEALTRAERVLGIPAHELDWTVAERSRGFLGLGGGSVTIEVRVQLPDPEPAATEAADAPTEAADAPTEAAEAPAEPADELPDRNRSKKKGGGRSRDRGRRRQPPRPLSEDDKEEFNHRVEKTREVATGLLEHMGYPAPIDVEPTEGHRIQLRIGDGAEELLDDGPEVMDSFQFLMNKIVNRFPPRWKVLVDMDGYAELVEEELVRKTQEWIREVERTGDEYWPEPMNARDRRIVHMEVARHDSVESRSDGSGRNRRMCIYPAD